VFARIERGLRPKRVAESRATVDGGYVANWEPALEVMREHLARPDWRNANLRVVVADNWIRYLIVPDDNRLTNDAERMMHARHLLSQAYGDMEEWTLTLCNSCAAQGRLATAIPTALLTALVDEAAAAGGRLISAQPRLVAAYNQSAARLAAASCWFVAVDDGSLAAAHVTPRGWDRVHAIRIGSDWSTELRRLRMFGRMIDGQGNDEKVFVDAPTWLRPAANDGDDGLEWLALDAPADRSTTAQLAWLQATTI
jgi:hypothetical protein